MRLSLEASDARVLRDYDPGRHARCGEAGTLARAEWRPAAALGLRESLSTPNAVLSEALARFDSDS
jgi:hypothetical protein